MERLVTRWPDFQPRFSRFYVAATYLLKLSNTQGAVGKSGDADVFFFSSCNRRLHLRLPSVPPRPVRKRPKQQKEKLSMRKLVRSGVPLSKQG